MRQRPLYMISVAAELVGMHPQTLRVYEMKGLVQPERTAGGTRLYSESDIERLRAIQRLTSAFGVNLEGVDYILSLERRLAAAEKKLASRSSVIVYREVSKSARRG